MRREINAVRASLSVLACGRAQNSKSRDWELYWAHRQAQFKTPRSAQNRTSIIQTLWETRERSIFQGRLRYGHCPILRALVLPAEGLSVDSGKGPIASNRKSPPQTWAYDVSPAMRFHSGRTFENRYEVAMLSILSIAGGSWEAGKPATVSFIGDIVVSFLRDSDGVPKMELAKDYGPCPRVRCHNDKDCRRAGGSQYCHCVVILPKKHGLYGGLRSGY